MLCRLARAFGGGQADLAARFFAISGIFPPGKGKLAGTVLVAVNDLLVPLERNSEIDLPIV